MQLFPAILHIYYIYSYRLGKSHCTKRGLKIPRISLSEFHLNNDKWDKKGQNTASSTAIFSLQPAYNKTISQCIVHNLSRFYFLCFHFYCFWQEGRGREAQRNPSFSALLFFLFFQLGCTTMLFHTGFCLATRNWRELYKNLTVLSSLDAYTQNQIQSKEFTSFGASSDT